MPGAGKLCPLRGVLRSVPCEATGASMTEAVQRDLIEHRQQSAARAKRQEQAASMPPDACLPGGEPGRRGMHRRERGRRQNNSRTNSGVRSPSTIPWASTHSVPHARGDGSGVFPEQWGAGPMSGKVWLGVRMDVHAACWSSWSEQLRPGRQPKGFGGMDFFKVPPVRLQSAQIAKPAT